MVAVDIFPGSSSPGKGRTNTHNLQVDGIPPVESLTTGLGSVAGNSSPGGKLSRCSGTGSLSGASHSPICKPPSALSPRTSTALGAPAGLSPRRSQVWNDTCDCEMVQMMMILLQSFGTSIINNCSIDCFQRCLKKQFGCVGGNPVLAMEMLVGPTRLLSILLQQACSSTAACLWRLIYSGKKCCCRQLAHSILLCVSFCSAEPYVISRIMAFCSLVSRLLQANPSTAAYMVVQTRPVLLLNARAGMLAYSSRTSPVLCLNNTQSIIKYVIHY